MGFPKIAFETQHSLLLTLADKTLIASDATTTASRWTLAFAEPLLGVAFVDPTALPAAVRESPWRSASLQVAALVVDAAGLVHVVDPLRANVAWTIGRFGDPTAFVCTARNIALAAGGRVRAWRDGHLVAELQARADVVAFGDDQLALAHRGDVTIKGVTTTVGGAITCLALRANRRWVAGNEEGLFEVGGEKLFDGDVRRVVLDRATKRLALQRYLTHIAVFLGSGRDPEIRVKYEDRTITDVAFVGPRLALALEGGHADIVDIATSEVRGTDRARASTAIVYGYRERTRRR